MKRMCTWAAMAFVVFVAVAAATVNARPAAEVRAGHGPNPGRGPAKRGTRGSSVSPVRAKLDAGATRGGNTRMERRRVWKRLRERWPVDAISPTLSAEMRRHAMRVAALDRIVEVARAQDDSEAARRAKALLVRERARHIRTIESLAEAARAGEQKTVPSARENPTRDAEGH